MGDFWEEIPDNGGAHINKKKKKQLQSLYHAWFHDDNEGDLTAGKSVVQASAPADPFEDLVRDALTAEGVDDLGAGSSKATSKAAAAAAAPSSASRGARAPSPIVSSRKRPQTPAAAAAAPSSSSRVRAPSPIVSSKKRPQPAATAAAPSASSGGVRAPSPIVSSKKRLQTPGVSAAAAPVSAVRRTPAPVLSLRRRPPSPITSSSGAPIEATLHARVASARRTSEAASARGPRQSSQAAPRSAGHEVAPHNRPEWVLSPPQASELLPQPANTTPTYEKLGRAVGHGVSRVLDTALYPIHSLQAAALQGMAAHPPRTPVSEKKPHNHPDWLLSPPAYPHHPSPEQQSIASAVGNAVGQALATALYPIHSAQSALLQMKPPSPTQSESAKSATKSSKKTSSGGAAVEAPKLSPQAQHWLSVKERYPALLLKVNHRPDGRNSGEMVDVIRQNPYEHKKRR